MKFIQSVLLFTVGLHYNVSLLFDLKSSKDKKQDSFSPKSISKKSGREVVVCDMNKIFSQ